jgi:opacity protein-like surface antigen
MTEPLLRRAEILVLSLLTAALLSCAFPAFSQPAATTAPAAIAKAHAYDAVTIKPDDTGNGFFKLTPDSFLMGGMPAWVLIRSAYGVLLEDQIVGLPGWAKSERIAVQAKTDLCLCLNRRKGRSKIESCRSGQR